MGQSKKKSSKSRPKKPFNKKEAQHDKAQSAKDGEVSKGEIDGKREVSKGEVDGKSIETPSKCVDTPNGQIDLISEEIKTPNQLIENNNHEILKDSREINGKEIETENKVIECEEFTPIVETPTAIETTKMPSEKIINATIIIQKQPAKDNSVATTENTLTSKENSHATKQIEVPYIPEDIKHPLENTWGFWLFTNENRKNWAENQKELTMFDTVEDYWCLYHHMKVPSELKHGQDYAVFKRGISPMWEDGANRVGGRWVINVDRKDLDSVWGDVVLLLIGENFENSNFICGAVVNVRPKNRVCIWTRNKEESSNVEIGKKVKEMLRINNKLQFLDHKSNSILYYA